MWDFLRRRSEGTLRVAVEFVVLALLFISPWPVAGVDPLPQFWISVAILTATVLAAIRLAITRRWNRAASLPAACLAGLAVLSVIQMVPLPESVVSVLSPGSADVYSYFVPPERELLPGEAAPPPRAGVPLSVFPAETRGYLIQCLAVLLLFCVVANNCSSPASFRRAAAVCVVAGAAVSLLGLLQKFTSRSDHLIYWSVETQGAAFGPFGNRNHYPFFVNICLSLAVGMLAAAVQKGRAVLQSGRAVWLLAAIGLMVLGITFCLSRGGFAAMAVALAIGIVVAYRSGSARSALNKVAWFIPAVVLLAILYGGSVWDKRLANAEATEKSFSQGRLEVWASTLKLVPRFLLFGTGNGTFAYVEPMNRPAGSHVGFFEHAHNEYVDALVEGGLLRLTLTAAFLLLVTRAGLRNYRLHRGRTLGWLILGGLVGFWAVAIHSAFDYGILMPAVAIAATVVATQVVCVRQSESDSEWVELPRTLCIVVGAASIAAAALAVREFNLKRKSDLFVRLSQQSSLISSAEAEATTVLRLQTAAIYNPGNVLLHEHLAIIYSEQSLRGGSPEVRDALARRALWHSRYARDACPLRAESQIQLAKHRDLFEKAPSAVWYLERACRAEPSNPNPWYTLGWERLGKGDVEGACRDWKRSLELSDRHRKPIVEGARRALFADQIIDKVLPDNPQIIKESADQLEPPGRDGPGARRLVYLEKALRLLDARGDKRDARDERLRGVILIELGRDGEGLASLQSAVAKDGALATARWDLASELYRRDNYEESRRQVLTLLSKDPNNVQFREMLEMIERDLKISGD